VRRRISWAGVAIVLIVGALAHVDPPYRTLAGEPTADAAIVMSGDVDYRRLERAVALFESGRVSWLVLTGAGIGGDSADTMRQLAIKRKVPADRVLVEPRATTTRENVSFIAAMLRERGVRTVALVTNASHMGRSERVARKVLPGIQWIPVPVEDPGPPSRVYSTRLQEWAKLAWYAMRGWI
jgi:uncharacterized SAM-binding protein YcdF (DUF218 family)